ncbi:MAG: hypothetical protein ACKVZH_27920 [Blastocatellia bacterium]
MFCPGCAIQLTDDTKFCKACGTNVRAVREAMIGKSSEFDWSKTWVAEMFMTAEERDRQRGITAEHKRLNEIKAGVITTLVGVGAMIFLRVFLGVIANNETSEKEAEILRHVWLAGIVPFLVGIGLLFNGIFLSGRRLKQQPPVMTTPVSLPTPTTNQLEAPQLNAGLNASVVEHTTAHLPARLSESREAVYVSRREDER